MDSHNLRQLSRRSLLRFGTVTIGLQLLDAMLPIGLRAEQKAAALRLRQGGKDRVTLANYRGNQVWRGTDGEKGFATPDGRPFKDITDYRRILLEDRDQLARNIATKLLI